MTNSDQMLAIATTKIAETMGGKRMSAAEMAKKTNIPASSVRSILSDIEGKTNPPFKRIIAMWMALGKNPKDLLPDWSNDE